MKTRSDRSPLINSYEYNGKILDVIRIPRDTRNNSSLIIEVSLALFPLSIFIPSQNPNEVTKDKYTLTI